MLYSSAQWIYGGDEPSPRNEYRAFRRVFNLENVPTEAVFDITADSRYRIWINGMWVGDGPGRSWPWRQSYDSYEVGSLLNVGSNVVAVLVNHYGESNMQYVQGRGGLLCRLSSCTNDSNSILCSDSGWKTHIHGSYSARSPRISPQMPFEEHYDARCFPQDWGRPDYDDTLWEDACVIGPAGCEPWMELVPRSVPFLTRSPLEPTSVIGRNEAMLPDFQFSISTRGLIYPLEKSGDGRESIVPVFACLLHSERTQTLRLFRDKTYAMRLSLNGSEIDVPESGKPFDVQMDAGDNLLTVAQLPPFHDYELSLTGFSECGLGLLPVADSDGLWAYFGPYELGTESGKTVVDRLFAAADAKELLQIAPVRALGGRDVADVNVFSRTAHTRPLEFLEADSSSLIVPPKEGDAVELFFDFGREFIGWLELDVETQSEAVLEANLFESIEDGKHHYSFGNNNALRYTCRQGRQLFTSCLRRGGRYVKLVCSGFEKPVTLHAIRVIEANAPMGDRGRFACSDESLTNIWNASKHTLLCCCEDTFTDCPLYEQVCWVGDCRIEGLVNQAVFGEPSVAARSLELAAESLAVSSLPLAHVPSLYRWVLPAWTFLWVVALKEHCDFYGDKEFLRRMLPCVAQTLETAAKAVNDDGLFCHSGDTIIDWAPLDDQHTVNGHSQMMLIGAIDSALGLIDRSDNVEPWLRLRERVKEAVNARLWSDERGAYVDSIHDDGTKSMVISQQTNMLALLYNLVPPEREPSVLRLLILPDEDVVRVGSPFAMAFLLECLAKRGEHDAVLKIIRDRWGSMLSSGSTTFWETFPGFDPVWLSRSMCHGWSSAPAYFLTRYVLGAWVTDSGRSLVLEPNPCGLDWCEGILPSSTGDMVIRWEHSGEAFRLWLEIPKGLSATFISPVSDSQLIIERCELQSSPTESGYKPAYVTHSGERLELTGGFHYRVSALKSELSGTDSILE